jgi:hypothetical protein
MAEIRNLIHSARQAVVHSMDMIQVLTNFEIGRRIVEHEQQGAERAEYGEATLKELAEALTHEFGKGFSLTNLKMMRKFYLTYRAKIGQTGSGFFPQLQKGLTASGLLQKTETLSGKSGSIKNTQAASVQFTLSWSHYVFLMGIKDDSERSFYEIEATGRVGRCENSNASSTPACTSVWPSAVTRTAFADWRRKASSSVAPKTCSRNPISWNFWG